MQTPILNPTSLKTQNPSEHALTSTEREKLINILTIILSHSHSASEYNEHICSALSELKIPNEKFLHLCIKSLQRVNTTHNDTTIISAYLFRMQNFLKLFKDIDEKEINSQIRTVAKHLTYEKMDKNILMMKIGDLGKKAYILLNGNVDVVVKTANRMKISIKCYLQYIAKLIKYKEYGLINFVLNDNFPTFHLIVEYDLALPNHTQEQVKDDKGNNVKKDKENEIATYFKLNTNNNSIRKQAKPTKIRKYKASQLLQLLYKKEDDNDNESNYDDINLNSINNNANDDNNINVNRNDLMLLSKKKEKELLYSTTVQNYIDRISIPGNILPPDELTHPHQHSHQLQYIPSKYGTFSPDEDDQEIIVNIYSYMKVATLTTGALFGEIALSNPLAQRTASIITTSYCHFGSLNKHSYNLSLKACKDKQLQRLLRFIISNQVFHGLNTLTLNKKYLNNFSFRKLAKGEFILQQGDTPRSIYLLREGEYEVTIKTNLNDLVEIIKHFYLKLPKSAKKIEILTQSQRAIANEVKVNKKLYKEIYTTQIFHISTAECPNVVGLSEFIDGETGKYAFNVECKSNRGEYLELSNIFYEDMRYKEYTIEENEEVFVDQKVRMMINRMNTIRNSKISTFFDFRKYTYDLGKEIESDLEKNKALKRKKETQKTIIRAKDIKVGLNGSGYMEEGSGGKDVIIKEMRSHSRNTVYNSRKKNGKIRTFMYNTVSNDSNYLGSVNLLKESSKYKGTPSKFIKDSISNGNNSNTNSITNFIIDKQQDKIDYLNNSSKFWNKEKYIQEEKIIKNANQYMKNATKNIKIESPSRCSLSIVTNNKNNENEYKLKTYSTIKTCSQMQTSFRFGSVEPFKILNDKKREILKKNNHERMNTIGGKSSDNPLTGVPEHERAKYLQITINDIKSLFICRRSKKSEYV